MTGFSELVKSFDKTRDYIRDFYIYGFKVRNEFSKKSSRTYDNEKRRIESWIGSLIRYKTTPRGKQMCISLDSSRVPENPLYSAYYSKSFTDNDIRLHFLLQDIMAEGGDFSVKELANTMSAVYGAVFDEQTVRNKLKEYTEEGIVIQKKQGKTDYFSLSPDSAESFFEKYEGFPDAVKFFSEAGFFGIVGNTLLKAADMKNDIFFIKHNYIVHTLEDEVLLDIINAIRNKHRISFINFGRKGQAAEKKGVPLKIYVSAQTGRRYLIIYSPENGHISSFRLDFIRSVTDRGECAEYDRYSDILREREKKCFGVSFGGGREEKITVTLRADEEKEKYIIDRLTREKRCCEMKKTGENTFTLTAEVYDTNEMMNWIKSFTGRIVSIEGTNTEIIGKFYEDIERMQQLYTKEGKK